MMTMMRRTIAWSGWLGLMLSTSAAAQAASVQAVLDCMSQAVPEDVAILQELRFETYSSQTDATPELLAARLHMRVRRDSLEAERRLQLMMRVQAPDYLAGASYLLREAEKGESDGMYVFLPSVARVRRISGGFANTALMGTEFSYNDFRRWQGLFGDVDVVYLKRGERQGRAVHQLRLTDPKPRRSEHDRVDVAVDVEHCLVVQADLYADGTMRKQLTVEPDHLRQFGSYWYPMQLTMTDLASGARTDLRVERIRARATAPEGIFDPKRFHIAESAE